MSHFFYILDSSNSSSFTFFLSYLVKWKNTTLFMPVFALFLPLRFIKTLSTYLNHQILVLIIIWLQYVLMWLIWYFIYQAQILHCDMWFQSSLLKNLEKYLANLVKAKVVKGALEMSYATMHINRTDSWVLWPYEMCEHFTYILTSLRPKDIVFSIFLYVQFPPAEILASFDLLYYA